MQESAPSAMAGLQPLAGTGRHQTGIFLRELVIGLTAFLTVVDLFATQAILPSLVQCNTG